MHSPTGCLDKMTFIPVAIYMYFWNTLPQALRAAAFFLCVYWFNYKSTKMHIAMHRGHFLPMGEIGAYVFVDLMPSLPTSPLSNLYQIFNRKSSLDWPMTLTTCQVNQRECVTFLFISQRAISMQRYIRAESLSTIKNTCIFGKIGHNASKYI